jgi:DNA recombination protein RmuC
MFLPYLLLVFQTICKTSQNPDLQKLDGYLAVIQDSARMLQDEVEGRISRALTMLSNSRDDLRANVARISSGLRSMRMNGHRQIIGEDANDG